MSKFIKGFFNKPGQTSKGEDTTPTNQGQTQPQRPVQKNSNDPFEKVSFFVFFFNSSFD